MAEEEWKLNLRMSREDFYELVGLIRPYASDGSRKVRNDSLNLETRVAIALYFLKDQGSCRMTANTFSCAISTVSKVLKEICSIISQKLGPMFIVFLSTKNEVKEAASRFEAKFGFPQAIGCIDGAHMPIKQPTENARDYFCYKMKYSINCQAICDEKGHFIDVDINWPGRVHDARVFANCEVQQRFVNGSFPFFQKELIPGDECIPQLLIGDPAYPLLPYVIKEYDSCQSNEQVIFNAMLRSARNQMKCAFGHLKARWRMLNRPLDIKLEDVPDMIYSCFVLHNFCERNCVDISQEQLQQIMMEEKQNQCCEHHQNGDKTYSCNSFQGIKIRNAITAYFKEYF